MMKTVCKQDMCAGCMACISVCSQDAITIKDSYRAYNAVIDGAKCIHCDRCHTVCPNNDAPEKREPIAWYQGFAKDQGVRAAASSGGLATALAVDFVAQGGVCCACLFENGAFGFGFAETVEEVKRFAGSKYVKSNPDGIYGKVQNYLKAGTPVLFIGLPCQVAALKKRVKQQELLYTVDLICHGTPSPKLLAQYMKERGMDLADMKEIKFREKENWYISDGKRDILQPSVRGEYTLAFLRSIDYTENCYDCAYASTARVSDITLGDSWGSDLPEEEQRKGLSLILCQSEKGRQLLDRAALQLFAVNVDVAISYNKQLQHPSPRKAEREVFFSHFEKNGNFRKAVAKAYPKICRRQRIKSLLIRAHVLRAPK